VQLQLVNLITITCQDAHGVAERLKFAAEPLTQQRGNGIPISRIRQELVEVRKRNLIPGISRAEGAYGELRDGALSTALANRGRPQENVGRVNSRVAVLANCIHDNLLEADLAAVNER